MRVLKMERTYKYFCNLMVGIRNVHIDRCLPNGRYSIPYNSGGGFVHPMAGYMEVLQCEEEWQPPSA